MAQFFAIHPDNPQERLIKQAADIVRSGGVIVYPTDSCYALGCKLGVLYYGDESTQYEPSPDEQAAKIVVDK